ncbi:hypothetical protein [Halorubrum sp. CBA1229]|uniref:hypothetical protein n=1 Tax=Halorubrum sp. CBA1229 TaxID=1853699 RepID=UPI0011CE3C63|nr:hypothetical protein [Halorubrum sp. CBA1229]QKY16394.1 hypothetical protein Hrr1229_005695 [Halorubrum sp. CBA1229]
MIYLDRKYLGKLPFYPDSPFIEEEYYFVVMKNSRLTKYTEGVTEGSRYKPKWLSDVVYVSVWMYFLHHISLILYSTEIASFTIAVWLANTGSLYYAIFVGVIGAIVTSKISQIQTVVKSLSIADSKVQEHKREREDEKRRKRRMR